MFVAMNRFKILIGKENDFENVWKNRETHLDKVPGFQNFNLIKGKLQMNIPCMPLIAYGILKKISLTGQNQKSFV